MRVKNRSINAQIIERETFDLGVDMRVKKQVYKCTNYRERDF